MTDKHQSGKEDPRKGRDENLKNALIRMYLENCIYKNEYPRNVKRFRDRKRHPRSYLRGKQTDNESKLIHGNMRNARNQPFLTL